MILVTGAAGKTGRAVIRALTARGGEVSAWVHRPEQARLVEELGALTVAAGNMQDPAAAGQYFRNVRAVYHICPNMSPDEIAIGEIVLGAALENGVEHLVYHSVLHPQTEEMPHHWAKLRVEEKIIRSGLNFTILQPTVYMQNVIAQWDSVISRGIYPVPYPVETRLSLVDLDDVAEAAAIVLTQPGHDGATYELAGTAPLSQLQVAEALSANLDWPVLAEQTPIEAFRENASGLGKYQVDGLVKMFEYYSRYGLVGNPNVLTWLLGRSPTSLVDCIARCT